VLIVSGTLIGLTFAFKLTDRVVFLYAFKRSVEEIKDRIKFSRVETKDLILMLKDKYPVLFDHEHQIEDKELFTEFLDGLGKTDTEGQLQFCEGMISSIDRRLDDAESDKKNKMKLYITLGISVSVACSIILY